MDDIVKAALAKWPNVPDCHDWLALDSRGDWYMRDERIQAAGAFPNPKGSRIAHDKLLAFICRNYLCDASGAYFFQNGPQRVFVELEAAPYIWRLGADDAASAGSAGRSISAHTGAPAGGLRGVCCDEAGRVFLHTELGFGLVHSQDMWWAAQEVEAGRWLPQDLPFAQMPTRFGYQLKPRPDTVSPRGGA